MQQGGNSSPSNVHQILQTKLEGAVKQLQEGQQALQKSMLARNTLEAQLNENELVQTEMQSLTPSDNVFKLVGPVLVKQDTAEAQQNVGKRIKYIADEVARHEEAIKALETKQQERRETVRQIQSQMEQLCSN